MQKWPLLLLLLTLIGSVLANVGIGPAQTDLSFDSTSGSQTVTLYAINLGSAQTRAQMSADGDLASYVTFDSINFLLGAGETKPVKAIIDIPGNYANGTYEVYINIAEIPVEETGTGYSVQSISSSIVNVNKITGAAVVQQQQNQTAVQAQNTGAQNQTNITQSPGGFVILPPKQLSPFEKFTGSFASFLSPFALRLSSLTEVQWLIIGLFAIVVVLLVVYLKEPAGRPQQPQLFAYQPQPPRYPPNYYPQQPRNDQQSYRYGR
jgi:hypothetical protein